MPLISVLSVEIKPDKIQQYQQVAAQLAERARDLDDEFRWSAFETAYGGVGELHFSAAFESYSELAQRGRTPEMITRVLGEKKGLEALRELGSATRNIRSSISVDRPDLSYPPEEENAAFPAAVITTIKARPGQLEACEELIRKLAEAIPKVGDPARMTAFQSVIGDLSEYWAARPLADLSELDAQLAPADLLIEAFGPAEGGLIYRAGLGAIEIAQRNIVIRREDLSNPG